MINAIIAGISTALFKEFGYENHMEEIKQDLKEPCFFIACMNPTFRQYLGRRYFRENQFVIQYFPESRDQRNAECNEVAERMNWCLEIIQAGDEPIRGTQMKYEIIDGVLNFFVNYDCFMCSETQYTAMENMEVKTGVKG